MGGRTLSYFALALALLAAACSDRPDDVPTSPSFAPPSQGTCNTTTVSSLAKTEFGNASDQAKLAGDIKGYGSGTSQATYAGYLILDAIADKYEITGNQTGSLTNASQLTIALLKCMNIASTPVPTSFEAQLGPSGAYAILGWPPEDFTTATSHDGTWILEPPAPSSWQDIRTPTAGLADSVKDLFLAHGQPGNPTNFSNDDLVGTGTQVFDWATSPEGTFSGIGAVVGECDSPSNFLQHNAAGPSAEVLGFVQPSCYVVLEASREAAPRSFAERFFRWVAPAPAFAALLTSSGTGGAKSKLSPFALMDPDFVNLDPRFSWRKSGNSVGAVISPTPKYQIRSQAGTVFQQDFVLIWLEALGNNGTAADICNNWAYTNADGVAWFPQAVFTKSGGYTTIARTTGTSSKPGVEIGAAPSVPPGASIVSSIINVKNGTAPTCTSSYHGEAELPTPPGPNGFAPLQP